MQKSCCCLNAYDVKHELVRVTIEIPDPILRCARFVAAQQGIALREFIAEAVKDKLAGSGRAADKPWMEGFGKLRHLRKETGRINRLIEEEFEQVEANEADY